jgi:hypothetical protein
MPVPLRLSHLHLYVTPEDWPGIEEMMIFQSDHYGDNVRLFFFYEDKNNGQVLKSQYYTNKTFFIDRHGHLKHLA